VFLAVALAVSALVAAVLDAERRRLAADEARLAAMEGADEQRRALFRSVAHELRTPLGIVHATGTELLDAEVAHSPEVQEHLLRLLVAETSRLARIVENLLAMSRIDAAAWRMEREPVDVGRAVDAAAARVAGGRDGPPLTVAVQPGLPDVLADPVQLDLVLTNLIENAVRHGGPGRPVHVGASFEGDQAVQVTVADQGPGIDPAVAERAFEPFVTSGDGRSTGIGLALCRTIVNGHGGTIELRGAHGGGTVVVVTLPLP
jgi:two-component system sensor histidine kinase KdpD